MIKIGTDCSGIEAPIEALKNICEKYDLSFEHEFSSEFGKNMHFFQLARWLEGEPRGSHGPPGAAPPLFHFDKNVKTTKQ